MRSVIAARNGFEKHGIVRTRKMARPGDQLARFARKTSCKNIGFRQNAPETIRNSHGQAQEAGKTTASAGDPVGLGERLPHLNRDEFMVTPNKCYGMNMNQPKIATNPV